MATAQLLSGVWLDKSSVLGEGAFGVVYKGLLGDTPVAIKTIKANSPEQAAELESTLLEEAAVWASVQHPNVVQFYGVHKSEEGSLYLVSELMDGSVEGLLHEEEERVCDGEDPLLDERQKLTMCLHVACALQRLHQLGILHSDLAARNVLYKREVGGGMTYKVTDFGLATVGMGSGAGSSASKSYQLVSREKLPVRWCAPEVLKRQLYSVEADIWSMGVYMWEVFSLAEVPYGLHLSNTDLFQKLAPAKSTFRLSQPEDCPDSVFGLMNKCWIFGRKQRIPLKQLEAELRQGRNALPKADGLPAAASPVISRPPQAAAAAPPAAGRGRGAPTGRGGAQQQQQGGRGLRGGRGVPVRGQRISRGAPMATRGSPAAVRGAPAASRGGRGVPGPSGSPTSTRGRIAPPRMPSGSVLPKATAQQTPEESVKSAQGAALLEEGVQARKKKDFKRAFALFKSAAAFDNPTAWAELGRCYAVGWGVEEDTVKALEYIRRAEKAGDALALHCLAFMHSNAMGLPEDNFKAADYWQAAADKGLPEAHHNLGWMYAEGISPHKVDMDKAFIHYLTAAEKGYGKSLLEVGLFYFKGGPVAKDWVKARHMLELAAAEDQVDACYYLGLIYEDALGVKQDYNKALEWYRAGEEHDCPLCNVGIARAYEYGQGVNQSMAIALKCYRKAADLGEDMALFRLGQIYFDGCEGLDKDTETALHFFKKTSATACPRVNYYLGKIFETGDSVTVDLPKAKRYYEIGWKSKSPECAYALAMLYIEGKGVAKDLGAYRKLLMDAEGEEYGPASLELGLLYLEGRHGQKEDVQAALFHFKRGSLVKDPGCMANLALFWLEGAGGEAQQLSKSQEYLAAAAEEGCVLALSVLAKEHSQGGLFTLDEELALQYCHKAATAGDMNCVYLLAQRLCEGRGCSRDVAGALPLLELLADAGAADPSRDLGILYIRGDGVEKNPQKAWELFDKAMENDPLVQVEIGKMYLSGEGAPKKSVALAKTHLEKAASYGSKEAEDILQSLKKSGRKLPWGKRKK